MTFYIALALIFWILVLLAENREKLHPLLVAVAIVTFVMLAGFRWETGYDWIAYEQALNDSPPLLQLSFTNLPEALRPMEALFIILLATIKQFGGSIQALYFIVALFNGISFFIFARYCRANFVFVFAIYFCWAYLLAQMGIMRQSIAVSFLMLSLIRFDKSRYISALALFLAGVFFQYSIVVLAPIFFTSSYKKIMAFKIPVLLGLAAFYFSGLGLFDLLGVLAENIRFSFIAEKLHHYQSIGPSLKTPAATAYFLLNIFVFLYFSKIVDVTSRLEKSLMLSILLMIIVEALLWQIPLFWNRTKYFVVIAQGILLYRTWPVITPRHKAIQLAAVFILSMAALVRPLLGEPALPYIPYQSAMRFIFTNNPGDGRKRLEQYNLTASMACPPEGCRYGTVELPSQIPAIALPLTDK
ncbi:EpsG-like putative glucosyltransferase [Collimonas sp. PA-H2]|uniref:EpsG family protein n=1 Tax=Collimonas sp. PA-H2 TaxID=1881062 RepID=UPI000BF8E6F7|nr:EpsG family protein [Collimonas sp. PA-H2]PFH09716.1 EpsG-like putative glucosyltransferase [Collimonas sp. PA-H2]